MTALIIASYYPRRVNAARQPGVNKIARSRLFDYWSQCTATTTRNTLPHPLQNDPDEIDEFAGNNWNATVGSLRAKRSNLVISFEYGYGPLHSVPPAGH